MDTQERDEERPLLSDDEHAEHLERERQHPALGTSADARGWLGEHLQNTSSQPSPTAQPGYLSAALHEPPKVHLSPRVFSRRATTAATRARRTAWIVIDDQAKRSFLQADKRAVIAGLGLNIPIRDMRLLDFNLLTSETGKLFVRDNAILFSIEHVRLIITAGKVLVPREGYEHNPLSNRFVDVLEEALADWVRQRRRIEAAAIAIETAGSLQSRAGASGTSTPGGPAPLQRRTLSDLTLSDHFNDGTSSDNMPHELQPLPFELVVLETALKEVVEANASQVKELEGVALPALDALTKSVSSSNLERVRKVKTRHQRLVTRCETLRDELERFLHDDDDMVKMCLSRRKELEELLKQQQEALQQQQQQQQEAGGTGGESWRPSSALHGSSFNHHPSFLRRSSAHLRMAAGSPPGAGLGGGLGGLGREASLQTPPPMQMSGLSEEEFFEEASEEVENLLETYFGQVDVLCDKLVNVGEYVKDTEEYINIELDSNRNRLIRLDIILTTAAFSLAPFNLIAGILGENLVIPEQLTRSVSGFYALNLLSLACVGLIFFGLVFYMRWRKLI